MREHPTSREEQRRLRRAASTAANRQPPPEAETEETDDDSAPGQRLEQQAVWADWQVRAAMARGDFDNLPGAGKPIRGLGGTHDPNWWVKSLIEREQITGIAPPALGLRTEDAELDARLDREGSEQAVGHLVDDFNRRVVEARRQLLGGPPVITATRDPELEVVRWRARRAEHLRRLRQELAGDDTARQARRRWWRRGS